MWSFVHRNLEPSDRLGEILFGLIMALGFTASARLGLEESTDRELFVSILGCNIAWAIVDAVMFALTSLFDRGRRVRLIEEVRAARSDEEAVRAIDASVDVAFGLPATTEEKERAQRWLLSLVRRAEPEERSLAREDILGAIAVALVIVVATLPVVVPFLFVENVNLAVRLSNTIAVGMLFLLGAWWGRLVGGSPLAVGTGLMGIGVALVLVTIALGG